MNWLDVAILAVLGGAVFFGLKTGLIKSVLSLAGLIAGTLLAVRFHVALAERLTFISEEVFAKVLAFAIIVVGALIVARLAAWLLEKVASALMVGWLNRLGGAAFGLVSGAILLSGALGIWVGYIGSAGAITDSRLAYLLLQYFPVVSSLFTR